MGTHGKWVRVEGPGKGFSRDTSGYLPGCWRSIKLGLGTGLR